MKNNQTEKHIPQTVLTSIDDLENDILLLAELMKVITVSADFLPESVPAAADDTMH